MSDINEKSEKKKDNLKVKSHRKKSIKSSKNKENAKNDNLMLTKIEEYIEIDKKNENFKDETCILKNLNKLFLNEDESGGNNLIGYTIYGKRNTVVKFNRSPTTLAIEKFTIPTKEKEKNDNLHISSKKNDVKNKSKRKSSLIYSKKYIDKVDLNNMTENTDNKENIKLMKNFKDNYESDDEEEHKNMNSNITRKLNKEAKEHLLKNTMFVRHSDLKDVLEFEPNIKSITKAAKELKSKRKQKSKKDEKIKKEEKSQGEESIKNEEKDILNQDNNNFIIPKRRENKSKTRKQRRVSFHCDNKTKNMIKELNQKYLISNKNIQKLEINKQSENDIEKVNKNFNRKRSKSKHITRNTSLHNYHFDFEKGLKLKKPKDSKSKLYQSVLFSKNNLILEHKNKEKEKEKEENNNSEYITNNNNKSKINNSSSSDSMKTVKKAKSRKKKNQMNIKLHKKESNKNIYHSIVNSSNNSNLILNDSSQIKSNNYYRNNIKNFFEYKMKHVNHFCIKSLNKLKGNKSSIIKLPFFSVVKPDKLVSIEYTRAYENNNRSFCLNKVSEDKLTIEHKNNDRNEDEDYKVEKKNKSFFCCL